MPTDSVSHPPGTAVRLPLAAARSFRFALTVALSLAVAYGLALPFPFFAPLFAILLGASPGPPPALRGLLALLVLVVLALGLGLFLTPFLAVYPVSVVLIIAACLYGASYLTVGGGKVLPGILLIMGTTMIPAAGLVEYALAVTVQQGLVVGILVAVVCQWLVYPLFPEPTADAPPAPTRLPPQQARWIAARATLIVIPPVLLAFTNPALYMASIIKTATLAQQGSRISARVAGRELIGSTFLAGLMAVVFWFALRLAPTLWMFFLWMLLFGLYFGAKLYGAIASRFPPSFWQNVAVTLLILLGPAVQDSATGKDVQQAFAMRFSLFVAITVYAWLAIVLLEQFRARLLRPHR